jgi:hypothetical protein
MFMRYLGGGVGHHNQQHGGVGSEAAEAMDIDEDEGEAESGFVLDENKTFEDWGNGDDDDEEDEEDDGDEGSDLDEDEDFGPEDGENEYELEDEYDDF